ncbi:hypothetical protein, partial [Photorhabdus sp. RM71S]|uniref:hypothetical protein n=1 Tax=Photorhabdus sp. RM71S TaxID=3342824 RepID=UPI0036DD0E4F
GTSGRYSLGTLKGQVGHGEAVSGMAQLFKVLFSLRDAVRVPTRLPDTLNPNINFETLPFELQSQLTVWQAPEVD